MKTKILLIASVAILGIGGALHMGGHEPKCLMKMMASEKPAVSAKTDVALAAALNEGHHPKNKKKNGHEGKNHDSKGHERKCQHKKSV